mmetsp:Transcript_15319/g.19386  ORF Transcript_15319/g.19386 Transcript_15319/m.19386 type:complete len:140 (-) Transcript_15319:170-589(-)
MLHGYESASNIAILFQFYIYKNAVLAASELCFNIFNGFSAHSFFLSELYTLHELVLTTLPPIYTILSGSWDNCCSVKYEFVSPERFKVMRKSHISELGLRSIYLILSAILHGSFVTLTVQESYSIFISNDRPYDASLYD